MKRFRLPLFVRLALATGFLLSVLPPAGLGVCMTSEGRIALELGPCVCHAFEGGDSIAGESHDPCTSRSPCRCADIRFSSGDRLASTRRVASVAPLMLAVNAAPQAPAPIAPAFRVISMPGRPNSLGPPSRSAILRL